jgi:hypothetical protein
MTACMNMALGCHICTCAQLMVFHNMYILLTISHQ